MNYLYAVAAATIIACSVYMILSRNLVRVLLGITLLSTGANLVIFQAGRIQSQAPPLIEEGAKALGPSADPLPQALVLTAIVIGFALTLILAALTLRAWRGERSLDSAQITSAESLGDPARRVKRDE